MAQQNLAGRIESVRREIDRASDVTFKSKRIELLDDLLREEERQNRLVRPRIFLSFAGKGQTLVKDVIRSLRKTPVPGSDQTFGVENGMKIEGDPLVLAHIRERIEPCFVFLGIMTREYQLGGSSEGQYAPGAWVLLEAGMAASLDLDVLFLIENGIHDSFWRHHDHVTQAHFDRANLGPGLKHAEAIIQGYFRKRKRRSE
jgi:hypothetical protein